MNENTAQELVVAIEELADYVKRSLAPVINVTPQGASVIVPPPPKCGYTLTIDSRDADGNIQSMTLTPDYE